MQIEWSGRTVRLSVRELAEFDPVPAHPERRGQRNRSRLAAGQLWHREMQAIADAETDRVLFEQTMRGRIHAHRWTFDLHGRVDQVVHRKTDLLFREVKSTSHPLPVPPDELQARYPHYFRQLGIYLAMGSLDPDYGRHPLAGELLFVDIRDGVTQIVPINRNQFTETDICRRIAGYLEAGRSLRRAASGARPRPAFPRWREGQEPALDRLRAAFQDGGKSIHLFEAPTGFGKTGLVLQAALESLQAGRVERILYASSKGSGQDTVLQHLDGMLDPENGPQYYRMQSRQEHRLRCPLPHCGRRGDCYEGLTEAWNRNDRSLWELIHGGSPAREQIFEFSEQTRICPYEISRGILDLSEIWIGDYNYIFNPGSRHVFEACPTFDPGKSLLILDEAHNLAERVAQAWSFVCWHETWVSLSGAAQFGGFPEPLREAIDGIVAFLAQAGGRGTLSGARRYEWIDLLETLVHRLDDGAPDLIEENWDPLWECFPMLNLLKHPEMDSLLWSTKPGVLHLSCLDAAPEIAETLRDYRCVLAMSATLPPSDDLTRQWGTARSECTVLTGDAPWRAHAYEVGIDVRADTRLRYRDRHYPLTARTVLNLSEASAQPIVVFFSSYRYAGAVDEYIQVIAPGFPTALQPRGLETAARNAFLDQSLLSARALLLVLGGSFAESIDRLGEYVDTVLVVGPALPEVNPVQESRMRRLDAADRDAAFREVFILPGITKINQALGRFVREPGQKARVVLQDRRFAETPYRDLLAPEYRNATIIRNDDQLTAWIAAGITRAEENRLHD